MLIKALKHFFTPSAIYELKGGKNEYAPVAGKNKDTAIKEAIELSREMGAVHLEFNNVILTITPESEPSDIKQELRKGQADPFEKRAAAQPEPLQNHILAIDEALNNGDEATLRWLEKYEQLTEDKNNIPPMFNNIAIKLYDAGYGRENAGNDTSATPKKAKEKLIIENCFSRITDAYSISSYLPKAIQEYETQFPPKQTTAEQLNLDEIP